MDCDSRERNFSFELDFEVARASMALRELAKNDPGTLAEIAAEMTACIAMQAVEMSALELKLKAKKLITDVLIEELRSFREEQGTRPRWGWVPKWARAKGPKEKRP